MNTLYHNPRCSKSRQAKDLLEQAGVTFTECLYLKAELDANHYAALLQALGGNPMEHLRKGEAAYKDLPADADVTEVAHALAKDPILLERPLLVTDKGALVCRPPEKVAELI